LLKQSPGKVDVIILAGQEILGYSASVTVTANEHSPTLPDSSVALYDTNVEPVLKFDNGPNPLERYGEIVPQLSETLGREKLTAAPHTLKSVLTEMFEGQVKTGA